MKNKALTAANRMRLDDYIRTMFHTFGITINDRSNYKGFIRTDSYFEIYIPILVDHEITNLKLENCRRYTARTFSDVKYFLNAEQKVKPEYFEDLQRCMREVIK